jgi:hypothetical protein
MDDREKELHDVVEKLLVLGEEEAELRFWESIFNELSEEEQNSVISSLKSELAELTQK